MKTATAKKSMLMPCPCCNEPRACVSLRLHADAGDENEFHCEECLKEFGRAEVEEAQARWAKWARVLAWIDTAPALEGE